MHANSDAKFAMQLGHAAPRLDAPGLGGTDLPLESGNWPIVGASAQQYLPGVSQTPGR
jgi:anthraniloyl-CoA monooxygenase